MSAASFVVAVIAIFFTIGVAVGIITVIALGPMRDHRRPAGPPGLARHSPDPGRPRREEPAGPGGSHGAGDEDGPGGNPPRWPGCLPGLRQRDRAAVDSGSPSGISAATRGR